MISADKELIKIVVNAVQSPRLKKYENNDRNICRAAVMNLELVI